MDPTGPIARRFPLVPRTRPACLPLPARAGMIAELATTTWREARQGIASTVINQAALLASDVGLPGLAREWCCRHATAYLENCPLGSADAIRALEPLVNLARLRARAGRGEDGHALLLDLYESVTNDTAVTIDGITVPEQLTASDADRREVRQWLWSVAIADGTRALTSIGQWQDAVAFLRQHRGIGHRMLDGRQVAVIARAVDGDVAGARQLLAAAAPGEPWEHAVAACLAALCVPSPGQAEAGDIETLIGRYDRLHFQADRIVFRTRLALSIVDAVHPTARADLRRTVSRLAGQVIEAADGHAARDLAEHPICRGLLSDLKARELVSLVTASGLGQGSIPVPVLADLSIAVEASEEVIMRALSSRSA